MMRLFSIACVGSLALAAAACSEDSTAFGSGTTATGQGGSTATGGTGPGGGGSTTTGGGGSTTTGGTGPGGSGGSGASGGSTGGNGGSGGDSQPVEIPCDNATCVTGEVCCVGLGPVVDPPYCETEQTGCADDEVEQACNDPSDCPGSEVCCVHIVLSGPPPPDISDVACESACQGNDAYLLCEVPQDCNGGTCEALPMLPGISVCQ